MPYVVALSKIISATRRPARTGEEQIGFRHDWLERLERWTRDFLNGCSERRSNPGGWVYEIDSRFDQDGRIPMSGIIRAWKVSPAGKPTGEVWVNPGYVPREAS